MGVLVKRPSSAVRAACASVAVGAMACVALVAPSPASGATTGSLGEQFERHGRYFGTAVSPYYLGLSDYASHAGSHFTSLTSLDQMKWKATEPTQGTFTFTAGDTIVAFAQKHGQTVRGHTLVWEGSSLPAWVSDLRGDALRSAMTNHISRVAGHFKGKVSAWDVVNEPLNSDGTMRPTVWQKELGDGYLATALRTAHAADPTAKLYINDYGVEKVNTKSTALYDLVKKLKNDGVPIHGVGLQAHFVIGDDLSSLQRNMQRFSDLGVDVAVTELDVRMSTPADAGKLAAQATTYRQVVKACLAVTRCVGITTWGFTDKFSWVPSYYPGKGAALPFDEDFRPKPAVAAMLAEMGASAGPAPAAGSAVSIKIGATNRCLDVHGAVTTPLTRTIAWDCHGNSNQKWTRTAADELRVYGTSCLDLHGRVTAAGSKVVIYPCHGGANQKWTFRADGTIHHPVSGRCLAGQGGSTAQGTEMVLADCSAVESQRWTAG